MSFPSEFTKRKCEFLNKFYKECEGYRKEIDTDFCSLILLSPNNSFFFSPSFK